MPPVVEEGSDNRVVALALAADLAGQWEQFSYAGSDASVAAQLMEESSIDLEEETTTTDSSPQTMTLPSPLPAFPSLPEQIFEALFDKVHELANYPGFILLFSFVILSLISGIGMVSLPMNIDTDFNSFVKTDVDSAIRLDAFNAALQMRKVDRRLSDGASIQASMNGSDPGFAPKSRTTYTSLDLYLAYELQDVAIPTGVFHSRSVAQIARFERTLRELPGWRELCGMVEQRHQILCDPGLSVVNYALPSLLETMEDDIVPKMVRFDGRGRDVMPPSVIFFWVEKHDLLKALLPSDATRAVEMHSLRSIFRFKVPDTQVGPGVEIRHSVKELWADLCRDELIPALRAGLHSGAVGGGVDELSILKVYFDGTGFEDFEIREAIMGDVVFAGGSAGFVVLYLLLHTRSVLLSLLGIGTCVLSVPLAYILTATISGSTTVTFASFLAIFLVIGFGCDVIFVYTDSWRDSVRHADTDVERVVWTLKRGASASLATTATTSLSFFANLVSKIRALRRFGFFMGVCVMLTWAILFFITPSLCLLDERRSRLCKGCSPWGACVRRLRMCWAACWTRDAEKITTKTKTRRARRRQSLTRVARLAITRSIERWKRVPSYRLRVFGLWTHHLRRWRRWYMIISLLALSACVGSALRKVKLGTTSPALFPAGHNRHRSAGVFSRFDKASTVFTKDFTMPLLQGAVCSHNDMAQNLQAGCTLFWCNAKSSLTGSDGDPQDAGISNASLECPCFRREQNCDVNSSLPIRASVLGRIVLDLALDPEAAALATDGMGGKLDRGTAMVSASLPPMVLQHWETGEADMRQITELVIELRGDARIASPCGFEDACFCGRFICETNTAVWKPVANLRVWPASPMSRGLSERAQGTGIPEASQAKVRVVLGLEVQTGMPALGETLDASRMWSFLSSFVPQDPWAQRAMLKLCSEVPNNLKVERMWCWILHFKEYLYGQGELFPVPHLKFDSLANDFQNRVWDKYVWRRHGSIRGIFISYRVNVHGSSTPADELQAYKEQWDAHIAAWNAQAAASSRGAFHVSSSWVESEVQKELIVSTVSTFIVLVSLAFLGVLAFTRSAALSVFVVCSTLAVIVGLLFFIVVVMDWEVGLLEVIAIIYFIGYAVTYSLHITHMYANHRAEEPGGAAPGSVDWRPGGYGINGHSVRRFLRVNFALQSIGGATLGSAITTAGSSAFLVLCTLTIFTKLGSMCLVVSVLSILVALGPLPAALLAFGPLRPGKPCTLERAVGARRSSFVTQNVARAQRVGVDLIDSVTDLVPLELIPAALQRSRLARASGAPAVKE